MNFFFSITYAESRGNAFAEAVPVLRIVAVSPLEGRLGATEVLCLSCQLIGISQELSH
jgi:hypothetical protein